MAQDYILHCRGCHLADGRGSPGRVPALDDRLGRLLDLPGGRAYLVQVPGAAQSELSNARLAALTNWMLMEFSAATLASDFERYTETEVARYRSARPLDISANRKILLDRLDTLGRSAAPVLHKP